MTPQVTMATSHSTLPPPPPLKAGERLSCDITHNTNLRDKSVPLQPPNCIREYYVTARKHPSASMVDLCGTRTCFHKNNGIHAHTVSVVEMESAMITL